ncbi:MAG TPA: glycosyltransferase family 4 protein, partial [Anaerolineaceae bacterium]
MHVAILHYAAPPVVGGVEEVIAHQARLLARAGHDVHILAGRGAAWDETVPVILIPAMDSRDPKVLELKSRLDAGDIPDGFGAQVESVERELRQALTGVELVIAHNIASLNKNLALTAALARITAKPGSPRLILWHHDLAWTNPHYRAELHPGWPWDLLRTPWPGAVQVTISAHRQAELSALQGIPPGQIRVIPNGIDLPALLRISPAGWELASRLDLFGCAPVLLTPVRVTRRKNLELSLRVLAGLRKVLPQAALVITGPPGAHNPSNLDYLRELLELRAQLGLSGSAHILAEHRPDGLTEEEVRDLYQLADGLLLPSREEGFGLPILEAGAARLPIFCTDLPPLRSLAGGWAEYFSPDGDPDTVASMVASRLAADPAYQLRRRVRL